MGKTRLFADGMENISFTDGMFRMSFFNSEMKKDENGKNIVVHAADQELIMPPQGFINAFSSMEKIISQLIEAGVIKRNAFAKQQDTRETGISVKKEKMESETTVSVSPNFQ